VEYGGDPILRDDNNAGKDGTASEQNEEGAPQSPKPQLKTKAHTDLPILSHLPLTQTACRIAGKGKASSPKRISGTKWGACTHSALFPQCMKE
jgi:hypothetical protein